MTRSEPAPVAPGPRLHALNGGLPVPGLAKAGALVIAVGLGLDLAMHTVLGGLHDAVIAGFSLGEHLAHLVVLIGMVVVIVGVIADGTRPKGRVSRPEGSPRDAVR
jgi:hypothetical protein